MPTTFLSTSQSGRTNWGLIAPMPCIMKRVFPNKPGCRAGKLFASRVLVGREAGTRCQEETRAAEKVAQVTM